MQMPGENFRGQYAGFGSRLIAFAIDLVFAAGGISIFWLLINLTIEMLKVREIIALLGWGDILSFFDQQSNDFVFRGLVFIFGTWFYHVFFLTLANRTIGKSVMGLQVVPLKGGRIGFVRATTRYIGYIVSTIPFFLGFIWILFSRKRQGWHDKIARTCVVYSWDAKPNDVFLQHGLFRLQEANEKKFGSLPED